MNRSCVSWCKCTYLLRLKKTSIKYCRNSSKRDNKVHRVEASPELFCEPFYASVRGAYMGAYDLHTPRLQKGMYRQFLSLKSWAKG
jgi:hypothetical protein